MAGKITQHLTAFLRAAAVRGSAEDRAEVNELAKKLNVDLAAVDFALPQKPQHGGSVCAGSPASTRGRAAVFLRREAAVAAADTCLVVDLCIDEMRRAVGLACKRMLDVPSPIGLPAELATELRKEAANDASAILERGTASVMGLIANHLRVQVANERARQMAGQKGDTP